MAPRQSLHGVNRLLRVEYVRGSQSPRFMTAAGDCFVRISWAGTRRIHAAFFVTSTGATASVVWMLERHHRTGDAWQSGNSRRWS